MGLGIGIDLGTSYSSVGVFRDNRFEVIPNEDGDLTTPSFVAFTETVLLIGNSARNQLALNPRNTVFNVQRLIGRRFADAEVQADIKHLPFLVVDRYGKPAIQVEYQGQLKVLMPEEIIAMILGKMKEMAEKHLGGVVENAVITAPLYWNASQRQSIRDAGLIAGLNVLSVTAAPTCAAVTYALDKMGDPSIREILVFDFGGGTFGATLATVEEGIIEVRSVAGDTHLGGEDFDNRLVNHFVNGFKRTYSKDLTTNARALCRLRSACERAKRTLSSSTRATIEIERLFNGIDFKSSITRARFEELCLDLFRSSFSPLDRVLFDAKIDKTKIHEVILVGGSTRIPKIQKLVTDYFNGKEPSKSLNPDQAACCGAAVYAAIYSGDSSSPLINEILLLDVAPLSLGIETRGGMMSLLVRRNTTTPTKKSEVFELSDFDIAYGNNDRTPASELPIKVYEGERARTKDNNLLGTFALMNVGHGSQIEITFDVDRENRLNIFAVDQTTWRTSSSYMICRDRDRLSKEELQTMIAAAHKYKDEAEAEALRLSAKNALESQIYSLKTILNELTIARSPQVSENKDFERQLDEALTWLDDNQCGTADEFIFQQKELEMVATQLKMRLNKAGESQSSFYNQSSDQDNHCTSESSESVTPNLSSYRSAEQRLRNFFGTTSENLRVPYSNLQFQEVASLLQILGYEPWSKAPKLYIVLRTIGQLQLLDSFLDRGVTDNWFPFTETSLAVILTPSMRSDFEKSQWLVLPQVEVAENASVDIHENVRNVSDNLRFALFDDQTPSLGA